MYSINCNGKLLGLDKPIVMGIINATNDSFYDSQLKLGIDGLISFAHTMIMDGASILDIGGQSSRPGSNRIGAEEEMSRVIPVIKAIHNSFPEMIISIDSYYGKVCAAAIEAGASIINDISAGNLDPEMIPIVAQLNVPYICMHMKGTPADMQNDPQYVNVVTEVLDFFIEKIKLLQDSGIRDIIIDPGFGFGKTIGQNFQLLKQLNAFSMMNKPLLVGLSRKRTVYKTLDITVEESLNGTTVLNTIALMNGASILRVHDVKAAVEAVKLYNLYTGIDNTKNYT